MHCKSTVLSLHPPQLVRSMEAVSAPEALSTQLIDLMDCNDDDDDGGRGRTGGKLHVHANPHSQSGEDRTELAS